MQLLTDLYVARYMPSSVFYVFSMCFVVVVLMVFVCINSVSQQQFLWPDVGVRCQVLVLVIRKWNFN